jgi:hypothetical protein
MDQIGSTSLAKAGGTAALSITLFYKKIYNAACLRDSMQEGKKEVLYGH